MNQKLYVGVDVSKARLDVSWCGDEGTETLSPIPNNKSGFTRLVAALAQAQPDLEARDVHLVAEPSGGYECPLVIFAFEQGWQVSLPNPKRVRDWAKAMGVRAKNDRLDSRILARYGTACRPAPQNCLPSEVAALDSLLRRRDELEQMMREERNRQRALEYKPHAAGAAKASVGRILKALEEELAEVESAIGELLEENPDLKMEARRLQTVAGIGAKTALPVLVFLYRWQARTAGQGTSKGLVAFAGLDPQEYVSGESVYKRATISKMGCTVTRTKLYLAARGGVRARSGPLRHFYDRLRGRGKPYRLALVAAARKILVWAFAVFTHKVPFDASLHARAAP